MKCSDHGGKYSELEVEVAPLKLERTALASHANKSFVGVENSFVDVMQEN